MTQIPMSTGDWEEIYYALESKEKAIKEGFYGKEDHPGQDKEWRAHLKAIMAKIARKVTV
jgi:hypothetical protein